MKYYYNFLYFSYIIVLFLLHKTTKPDATVWGCKQTPVHRTMTKWQCNELQVSNNASNISDLMVIKSRKKHKSICKSEIL